jgi:hypothetical protein
MGQFDRSVFGVQRTATTNLKKQTQFLEEQNERKYLCEKELLK